MNRQSLLKTLPGIAVSAFFLWYTFKGISFRQMLGLHVRYAAWIAGVLGFTAGSYTLRCVRWTRMMRPAGARFAVCARVLMISLAANNILPLRIGDIMRVFTYADELGAAPSMILSTVILEKLLDVFVLGLMFVWTMGVDLPRRIRVAANDAVVVSAIGLMILMFAARWIEEPLRRGFARTQGRLMRKLEGWMLMAVDTLRQIGFAGSCVLLLQTATIWAFEGMIYVSAARLFGLMTDRLGPWEAVSFGNLSYLLPSSPGAIGTFEWALKTSLVSHGAPVAQGALFGLTLHAWLLISVTGAGGIAFLVHRARATEHSPLLQEVDTLTQRMTRDPEIPVPGRVD